MVDHPSQLATVEAVASRTSPSPGPGPGRAHAPGVFLKIDTSYGRAGVAPGTAACAALVDAALAAERAGACVLQGLYSHAGHSYGARGGPAEALAHLAGEFAGLARVARTVRERRRSDDEGGDGHGDGEHSRPPLVLSVGATPTATAVQQQGGVSAEVERWLVELKEEGYALEVHAGV